MKTVVIQSQQKWECLNVIRHSEAAVTNAINHVGQQGWELVSVIFYKDAKGNNAWIAFLKRPSTGQAPKAVPEGAAAPGEKPPEEEAQAPGWDLEGETFDVKKEP